MLFGEAILFQSGLLLIYTAAIFTAFHLRVILYEEPTLREKFGLGFEEYIRRVPRWI